MAKRSGFCGARSPTGRGSARPESTGKGGLTAGAKCDGASSEDGPMPIGLDTSVVVRLLIGLPEAQARTARRRLELAVERRERVVVSDLVLAETYHALQHHYRMPKREARSILHRF